MITFRRRTIIDPDGNIHHNPHTYIRGSHNLRREHAPVLVVIALLIIIAAGVLAFRQLRFEQTALRAAGTVIRLDKNAGTTKRNKKSAPTYREIFAYSDKNGVRHEYANPVWSSSPYPVGTAVPLLYDPNQIDQVSIDSFFGRFGLSSLLGLLALIPAGLGFVAYFLNPGTGSYLHIDGKTWESDKSTGIPHTSVKTSISFGKGD